MDFLNVKSLFIGGQEVKSLSINNRLVWQKKPTSWKGLKFENVGDGTATLSIAKDGSAPDVSLMCSTDGGETWTDFVVCSSATSLDGTIITLPSGLGVCFKAGEDGNQTFASSTTACNRFMMSGSSIKASGNINSLLDGENFEQISDLTGRNFCFLKLFYECTSLVDVSEIQLPATLAGYCYYQMFYGCTSLVQAPELPATTLAGYCYYQMFYGCTSLAHASDLPATTLASNCYRQMFRACTSLVQAPELPATALASNCYDSMLRGCTSLVQAPELPATALASNCYTYMFQGCTSLNSIKLGYSGNFSSTNFNYWVSGVSSAGTFYYNGSDTTRGANAIPTGWAIEKF